MMIVVCCSLFDVCVTCYLFMLVVVCCSLLVGCCVLFVSGRSSIGVCC